MTHESYRQLTPIERDVMMAKVAHLIAHKELVYMSLQALILREEKRGTFGKVKFLPEPINETL